MPRGTRGQTSRRRRATLLAGLAVLVVAAWQPVAEAAPIGPLGKAVRVTHQGTDGDTGVTVREPDVAYNPHRNEFFVVYTEVTGTGTTVWGQLTDGGGRPKGTPIEISLAATEGAPTRDAAVAYDPVRRRYAVAYIGNAGSTIGEELYVRLVDANGTRVPGACSPPSSGCHRRTAIDPVRGDTDVVFDAASDSFVIAYTESGGSGTSHVWLDSFAGTNLALRFGLQGSPNNANTFESAMLARPHATSPLVLAWTEQVTGVQRIFVRPFQVTTPPGSLGSSAAISTPAEAFGPVLARNPSNGEIVVAYHANAGGGAGNEIFVQRLRADLSEVGLDRRISCAGVAPTCVDSVAVRPAVAFDPVRKRYLVVWAGTDVGRPGGIANDKTEVMGQLLDAAGAQVGPDDFVVSNHGAPSIPLSAVQVTVPSVGLAVNTRNHRWLSVWTGDLVPPTVNNEFEVYSRFVGVGFRPDGLVSGAATTGYAGNGVYNTTAAKQTKTAAVRRGGAKTFYVRAQNDGDTTDTFRVKGCKGGSGFAVTYLAGAKGSKTITKAVVGGTYKLANVASGQQRTLRVRIAPGSAARVGATKQCTILLTSAGDATRKDAVRATVRAR